MNISTSFAGIFSEFNKNQSSIVRLGKKLTQIFRQIWILEHAN